MAKKYMTIIASVMFAALFISSCSLKQTGTSDTSASPQVVNYTVEAKTDNSVQNIISVVGTGSAKARPDLISFRIGIEEIAETTSAALSEANRKLNAIYTVLEKHNIAKENAVTSSITIGPRTKYNSETRTDELIGQAVSETVVVSIEGIASDNEVRLANIIDELGLISGIRINSISFSVKDKESLYREARKNATFNALAKADDYASGLGITVKEIKSITEGSIETPYPYVNDRIMYAAKATDESYSSIISSGEYEVSVKVTLVATI